MAINELLAYALTSDEATPGWGWLEANTVEVWKMEEYSGLYNLLGDNFNIEAVCPYYDPENQHAFTWRRDERGVAIVSGYDPENDLSTDWLCDCGHYETSGFHCSNCGAEPPWGCDCGEHGEYDDDLDFGLHHSEYDIDFDDWDDEPDFSYHPEDEGLDDWGNKYGTP